MGWGMTSLSPNAFQVDLPPQVLQEPKVPLVDTRMIASLPQNSLNPPWLFLVLRALDYNLQAAVDPGAQERRGECS